MSRWDNEDTSDVIVFPVTAACLMTLDYSLPWTEHIFPVLGIMLGASLLATLIIVTLDSFFPHRKRR